jgi:6-phosphogluconolactonase
MLNLAATSVVDVYLGTYTGDGGSKGIYRLRMNLETGALSQPELAAETTAPSYLAWHPDGKTLYAVNEFSGGEAAAFAVEGGKLRERNRVRFQGGGPCHISVHPSGRHAFVAAYGGGTVAVLPIRADGSLEEARQVFQNHGSGPNKSRQEAPHLHFVAPSPDGKFVYACDLGTDEVLAFRFQDGELALLEPRAGKVPPGGGPRHFVLHPNGKTLYANLEMTLGVAVFDRDVVSGALKLSATASTLPPAEPIGGSSTAAIRIDPSGKWLAVSNRGHNSLALFPILADGKLGNAKVTDLGVQTPRDFAFDPSGKWVLAAGQDGNEVAALRFDPSTGDLQPTAHRVHVGRPVCVLFAP